MNLFRLIIILFSPEKQLFFSIKNIFGYYPRNIYLYKLAFRHKSVSSEIINGIKICNERLEYLGDAVLSSIVADFLFKRFPFKDEGFLTEMRSKIVNRSQLNKLSRKLGLDKFILAKIDVGSRNNSIKGNAFEAFIGAMYLDKGYSFTKKILINYVINVHFDIDKLETIDINFKSKLLEWTQKEKKSLEFKTIKEIGTGFSKQYIVKVYVDNKPLAEGQGFSIKAAEQSASEKAFIILNPEIVK